VTLRIVTSWATAMRLAAEVGRAKRAGDAEAVAVAEAALADYEAAIRISDEVILP